MGSSQEDPNIMRCSVSYFIELKGGQARVNRLIKQQHEYVVVLRNVVALCTCSVLAFLNTIGLGGLVGHVTRYQENRFGDQDCSSLFLTIPFGRTVITLQNLL